MNLCTTLIKQSKELSETKPAEKGKNDDSLKETNAENYVKALYSLIELIDKDQWNQNDLNKLQSSCGFEFNPAQSEKPEES